MPISILLRVPAHTILKGMETITYVVVSVVKSYGTITRAVNLSKPIKVMIYEFCLYPSIDDP